MSRCIIVLATGRSGSSAVSGMLHHIGVHMTDKEHTAGFNHRNHPGGHWEDLRWHRLGLDIMDAGFPYQPTVAQVMQYEKLASEREEHPLWGVKTPTFSLILKPLLQGDIFPDATKVVAVHRSLVSCALSRVDKDRPRMTYDEAVAEQVKRSRSMLGIIQYCNGRKIPVHHISYERLLKEPLKHAAELSQFIRIGWTDIGMASDISAAAHFIRPDYARY